MKDSRNAAPQQPNGKSPTECQANGCPLPGVYRIANDASMCCVHDGEDPHQWPEQSERILSNMRLWWVALSMSNSEAGSEIKPETIAGVIAAGGPDATDAKTQRDYASKIRGFLLKKCKGERKTPAELTKFAGLVKKLTVQA